jgi:hypothetical protein
VTLPMKGKALLKDTKIIIHIPVCSEFYFDKSKTSAPLHYKVNFSKWCLHPSAKAIISFDAIIEPCSNFSTTSGSFSCLALFPAKSG